MSNCCDRDCAAAAAAMDTPFRKALWIALAVNAAMFGVEIAAGLRADSVSLLADAVDFFGDAANYGVSLFVLALAPAWRSRAALAKGLSMGAFGLAVLALSAHNALGSSHPDASTMGGIGLLALVANLSVAALLYRFRSGDANMQSVWLCSRNDAIGNVAVLVAAAGVFGTGSAWPDLVVAAIMATLALTAAVRVIRRARAELRVATRPEERGAAPSRVAARRPT